MSLQPSTATVEAIHAASSLDNFRSLLSQLEDAIAFSRYLQHESALELQQMCDLVARSKRLLKTSRELLNHQCTPLDN